MEYSFVVPDAPVSGAVLVLAGSSGRMDVDRVRLLSAAGAAALSPRWFGGPDQPPGICEIPLETFAPALDRLAAVHDNLVVVGSSKGAEAALLLAARDARIRAVVAMAPSSVVWANTGPGRDGASHPYRSSWTEHGEPLPFVPFADVEPPLVHGLPSFRPIYEQSLRRFPDRAGEAAIPVERIAGRVVLSAGGDDQVWPSARFAAEIAARRRRHGLATEVIVDPAAGHLAPFPGQPAITGGLAMAWGGTAAADAAVGHQVWAALLVLLDENRDRDS